MTTRISELTERRVPFVQATVVRAQCPTSARPGDSAIVLADGTIEGFVGGQCAESSVQLCAGDVIESGEAMLLRILPESNGGSSDGSTGGSKDEPVDAPGARTVVNPCLSGGAIEVFLEPKLPAHVLCVVGNTPIADAIVALGQPLGFLIDHVRAGDPRPAGALAVIISSHGRGEEDAIVAAIEADVSYVGLVASATRAEALLAGLDLAPDAKAIIRAPVGVDIGARTAEEIALSILAEIVREVRVNGLRPAETAAEERPAVAVDPICGMQVTVMPDTAHLSHDGVDYWYCNVGCRTRHADDLAAGITG